MDEVKPPENPLKETHITELYALPGNRSSLVEKFHGVPFSMADENLYKENKNTFGLFQTGRSYID